MKPKRASSGKHVRARGGTKVKSSPKGLLLAAIGVIVVLLLVVYFTIASSYKGRFLGRTTINGLNCSGKTVQEVNTAMNLQAKNYVLTLKERDGKTETINGGDIDLTYVDNGQVAALLDDISPYGWLWSQIRGTELTVQANMSYDETKFETVISHLSAFNPAYAEAPTDAQIVAGDTQFQIQKESEGRELDNEKALKLIQEGIKTGVTEIDFEASECYKKPSVYENDQNLKEQLEKVNGYLKAKITYDFDDRTIEVTAQDIMAMIAQDDKGNYGLDKTKVKEFVTTKLAYATDTFGLTHAVKCHDGKTRKLTGGDYGWCINRDKTTEELIPLLESGAEKKIEPAYLYSAKSRAKDDIGGTYVEISISNIGSRPCGAIRTARRFWRPRWSPATSARATAPLRAASGPSTQRRARPSWAPSRPWATALPSPIGCPIAATWVCTTPTAGGTSTAARSTRPTAPTAA